MKGTAHRKANTPRVTRPRCIVVGQALGISAGAARFTTVSTLPSARDLDKTPEHKRQRQGVPAKPPAPTASPAEPTTRTIKRAVFSRRHRPTRLVYDTTPSSPRAVSDKAIQASITQTHESESSTTLAAHGMRTASTLRDDPVERERTIANENPGPVDKAQTTETATACIGEKQKPLNVSDAPSRPDQIPHSNHPPTKDALCAYENHDMSEFLRLTAMMQPGGAPLCATVPRDRLTRHDGGSMQSGDWTVDRKREAFARIRDFFWTRLDVGLNLQRTALRRYLEARTAHQGLFIFGSSPLSTSLIVRALLRSLATEWPNRYDFYHVKGHLYSSPHDLYDAIRHQMHGKWKLPQWRNVEASLSNGKSLPPVYSCAKSVLVVESIDTLVKSVDRKQAPLDRLFRFFNCLVQARGLRLLVIGHCAQTMQRFTSYFGGFLAEHEEEYMLRLPEYDIQTIATHLEGVATAALAPMGDRAALSDVFAPRVIEFAARKAAKAEQCELDPVLSLLRFAMIRMLCECRHDKKDFETDQNKWKLRYEHVLQVSSKLFQDDYVHRIQCVGTITQAVLLVLIDAGPCTEEELFQHVYERHTIHPWILIITQFKTEKFDVALELLLSVPVVRTREVRVHRGESWLTEIQYIALPSRAQFIEAAGKKPLIKLIL